MPKSIFSDNFVNFLIENTKGYISPDQLEDIIAAFENEAQNVHFTYSSESNLIRILSSIFDKKSFLIESRKYPHHIEIITNIAQHSNYLTDVVVRNPEYLYLLFDPRFLSKIFDYETIYQETIEGLNRYKTFNAKVNFLRLTKSRHLLRIGINDILGNSDLTRTTAALSDLAKVLINIHFHLCYSEILNKYTIRSTKRTFCLIVLGKLGGHELNYSSDVDLILFFDKKGKAGKKEYFEILVEAAHLFAQSATSLTEKGSLYRVDFRLRPDGRNSPLARTLADMIKYYEVKGEDWERQMLIKMDYIAGDKKLYETLNNSIQSFIYPSSFTTSPFEQIKKMKRNIEKRVGEDDNIKLQIGGIRDIEFGLQALQLMNGGKNKRLRTGNSLEGIKNLTEYKFLSVEEAINFKDAYIFYRKIEHYLQLMNNIQTHTIPESGEIVDKLSDYLKFPNQMEFYKEVEMHKQKVRTIFNSIVEEEDNVHESDELLLSKIFSNVKDAEKNFQYLRTGTGLLEEKKFDKRTITQFEKIEREIINYLTISSDPDRVLENFVKIIKSTSFPSIWYNEFQNSKFLNGFLKICEFSQIAVNLLIHNPSLGEMILSRSVFAEKLNESLINYSSEQLKFAISVQYGLKLIQHEQLAALFKEYVKNKIKLMGEKYLNGHSYFIGGLGSFGPESMSFNSDLDIIIVSEKLDTNSSMMDDVQHFIHDLKPELKLFEIDLRLRPEGNNSPLVWDLEAYNNYFKTRARIWEFQSYLKLDFISGDENIFTQLKSYLAREISLLPKDKILIEITQMYNQIRKESISFLKPSFNFKKSRGSLLTINFLIEYLLLSNADLYNKCIGKNPKEIIIALKNNAFDESETIDAIDILSFFKTLEGAIQNIFAVNNSLIPDDPNKLLTLSTWLGYLNTEDFNSNLNEKVKMNLALFNKYLI